MSKDKDNNVIGKYLTAVPSGFLPIDYMLGKNIKDGDGKLIMKHMGHTIGGHYGVTADPSAGKTTLILQMICNSIKLKHNNNYPLIHIDIFDSDGTLEYDRVAKLADVTLDKIHEYVTIHKVGTIIEATTIITELQKEYDNTPEQREPVMVTEFYTGKKFPMYPYRVLFFDTITALTSADDESDSKKKAEDIAAKATQNNMDAAQRAKAMGNLVNQMSRYFNRNCIFYYAGHYFEQINTKMFGGPTKQWKAGSAEKYSSFPTKLRAKLGYLLDIKTMDMSNRESPTHPINTYKLPVAKTDPKNGEMADKAYCAILTDIKSKSSLEGVAKINIAFVGQKYNPEISLVTTAKDQGLLVKETGRYPSAADPSVLKADKDAYELLVNAEGVYIMGDENKELTSLSELNLLLSRQFTDEAINAKKARMYKLIVKGINNKMKFLLDGNNVTYSDVKTAEDSMKFLEMVLSDLDD